MSVTVPLGFRAAGVTAGLKVSGDPDVAVVLNEGPSHAAAAVFTSNRVKAAPVRWTEQVARGGQVRAVVLNSGGANACTGPAGDADTRLTAQRLADAISCPAAEIAVCSTGLIGQRLAMDLLLPAVDKAAVAADSGGGGARRRRDQDHGHHCEGGVPAGRHLRHRRHGQGRGHAGSRPGDNALRAHHRRGPAAGRA